MNTYYRRAARGMMISARGQEYRAAVEAVCLAAGRPTLGSVPVRLEMVAHRPDMRRRDLDNILKSLLDALRYGGVYEDDSQIEHLDVRFAPLPLTDRRGTVDIVVRPLLFSQKLPERS